MLHDATPPRAPLVRVLVTGGAGFIGAHVTEVLPEKARDVLLFGVRCARDPQGFGEADFDVLRRHGLGEPEILEIISMAALAVYANIIADATGMRSDEMFSPEPAAESGTAGVPSTEETEPPRRRAPRPPPHSRPGPGG